MTEPLDFDPTSLAFQLSTAVAWTPYGEGSCCLNGPRHSCSGELPCVFEEGTAQLRVAVDFDLALEQRGQFVYRVTWSAAGNETRQDDWDSSAASRYAYFDVEAPEYCATLSIRHLTDGEITELETQCIAHGDLGPIGVQPWPDGNNPRALAQCTVPPPNYHAEWCSMLDQVAECTADDCGRGLAAALVEDL